MHSAKRAAACIVAISNAHSLRTSDNASFSASAANRSNTASVVTFSSTILSSSFLLKSSVNCIMRAVGSVVLVALASQGKTR